MSKYALLFSKTGYIRYTSHLDLLRIFKRAFRRAGIDVSYSQGFNPHPRIGFCQPLSLGYTGLNEIIEFQTETDSGRAEWLSKMQECLPSGIGLISLGLVADGQKTLAGSVCSADYEILFHIPYQIKDFEEEVRKYLAQEEILCEKRMKSGGKGTVDIKQKIRSLECFGKDGELCLAASLDSGSSSNLSPELLIKSFTDFAFPYVERHSVSVCRKEMRFDVDYKITWM